ncbi:hypothetical protein ACN28I_19590 [Archangium gephyra]|uniref:hypothetical protein n=1 Tax=Archangium gephyra TaxID=48 RepID=UPI003B7BAC48
MSAGKLDGAGGESLQVGVAFRLAVDEPHQRIRVAYTAHHQVLLSDFEGRVLSRQFRSCRYPSAMARIAEDEFLVSDTRGARIVRVSGRDEDFGKELGEFSVQGWSAQPGHTRPKGVAITGDGTRWIVMTDENIGNGELYRLGREASTPTRIPLPENTDTMFPEALADSVLLPDGGVYRIHRFTLDGTRMSDFGSPELKARLAGFATRTRTLGFVFKGSYIGLLLVSLPMLIAALWMQRKAATAEEWVSGPVESLAGDGEPYRNPESRSRELRGEYLFQRRFTVLDAREVRRVGLLMAVPYALLCLLLPLMLVGSMAVLRPSGDWNWGPIVWFLGLEIVGLGCMAVWHFQCHRHERLSLDARGLRYVSSFSGLLAPLHRLVPSWELAWEEIEHITLRAAAGGRAGAGWYYELRDRSGKKRRINALSWRLVGEDETGLTLQSAQRFSPAEIQAVIRKTRLHRQLAEHLPALTSSR